MPLSPEEQQLVSEWQEKGKRGAETAKPKASKYGNRRTEYNGIMYDSQREAEYAAKLDLLLASKLILWWCRQAVFVLEAGVTYKCDFIVKYSDRVEVVDCKGVSTDVFKLKKKLLEARFDVELVLV